MASRDWHTANNLFAEIQRLSAKAEDLIVHCSLHPGSALKNKIDEINDQREGLYDRLTAHIDLWLEKIEGAKCKQ